MSPFPLVLSAPSGAGKTTIARRLVKARSDIVASISATTRDRRDYEKDGVDYFFVTDDEFHRRRLAGDFAECAEVHGKWYGTLRTEVQRALAAGKHVLLDIDVQGARAVKAAFDQAVLVFILPPSLDTLLGRLEGRNSESEGSLKRRLRTALSEIETVGEYHYVVVNDQLDAATAQVSAIIDAEATRTTRVRSVDDTIAALVAQLRRDILAKIQEF